MDSSIAPTRRESSRKRKAVSSGPEGLVSNAKVARTNERANDETQSTRINDLPDELLGRVIRALEPKERVFSELISRRWERVSRTHGWLDFRLIADEQWSYIWKQANWRGAKDADLGGVVERELKCLLTRCAPTMHEIDLCGIRHYGLDGRICELLSGEMGRLEKLILDRIRLSGGSELTTIGERLPWLKEISLKQCYENAETVGFPDALAALLSQCRRLESLNLAGTGVSINSQPLFGLPSTLRRLDISHCPRIQPSVVDSLLATCAGSLKELRIGGMGMQLHDWTNAHLERLFTGLPSLELLHFWEFLDDAALEDGTGDASSRLECLGALENLRRLQLKCNKSVTSEVLDRIIAGCRELESLELISCHEADNFKPATARLAQLPKLTHLRLDGHQSVNDATLTELAKGPAPLQELGIYRCQQVTDKGVGSLLDGCSGQLRELNVGFCPLVTQTTVAKLEALYNGESKSGRDVGSLFVLRADATNLGFAYKEFGSNRRVE